MDFKTGNTLEAKRRMASDVGFNGVISRKSWKLSTSLF
jgi:hypothetical protein